MAYYATTKLGWMENSILETCIKIFVGATKDLKKPVMLIYDGHNSHLTYRTIHTIASAATEECMRREIY